MHMPSKNLNIYSLTPVFTLFSAPKILFEAAHVHLKPCFGLLSVQRPGKIPLWGISHMSRKRRPLKRTLSSMGRVACSLPVRCTAALPQEQLQLCEGASPEPWLDWGVFPQS